MKTEKPITEYIAESLQAAINHITIAAGFHQTLVAIRRSRIDFRDVTPTDGHVLIMQVEDEQPGQPLGCAEWIQKYLIACIVLDSDDETTSIEARQAQVRDDIRKKLMENPDRNGHAIDTINGPCTPFDDEEGLMGIILETDVHYRTKHDDPYERI